MSPRDDTGSAPPPAGAGWRFLHLMRVLERRAPHKPRVGRNRRMRDAVARLGQDPSLAFPDTEISEFDLSVDPPVVRPRFLGLFGGFGPLPLNLTEEIEGWLQRGGPNDAAFARFCDILSSRFMQLYFRAWSDARAIAQFDHPQDDRFLGYLLGLAGSGTPAFRDRDSVADVHKAGLAALAIGRVRSPARLRQILAMHLGLPVEIHEFEPTWLPFRREDLTRLGRQGSTLGLDAALGDGTRTLADRIRVHVAAPDLARYRDLLPGRPGHDAVRDLILWYLGPRFEVVVSVSLPVAEVPPVELGRTGELGWLCAVGAVREEPGLPGRVVGTRHRMQLADVPA